MPNPTAKPKYLKSPVRDVAPVALTVHPILRDHPQWDDEDPQFDAFCRDIHEYGIDQPIIVDSKDRIVDGRQRWRASKRLKLETVPIQTVSDQDIGRLVIHYILARRHYAKGALAYMSLPLIHDNYSTGSRSLELVIQEFGFSPTLYRQAEKVREIFGSGELGELYRKECEPKILSGDNSLGDAIAGWAGMVSTKGKKKEVRQAIDLWKRSFTELQRRFSAWDNFDPETKNTISAGLVPLVETMPLELMQKLSSKIAAELKNRKEAK